MGYIEAGHVTYAYATTVHKAQSATVGRALVLGDDALAREPAYSGLSRGAVRNDLYVLGAPDRHENHHLPVDPDDNWDELMAAIDRTLAQRHASDQLPSSRLLSAEKRGLQRKLRDAPRDRSTDLQRLADERQRLHARLLDVERREASVIGGLDRLGGLRRITRRDERHRAAEWLDKLGEQREALRSALGDIDERTAEVGPDQDRYDDWEDRHRPDLDRLRMIERLERFEAHPPTATVERPRGAEHDPGLGLEL